MSWYVEDFPSGSADGYTGSIACVRIHTYSTSLLNLDAVGYYNETLHNNSLLYTDSVKEDHEYFVLYKTILL